MCARRGGGYSALNVVILEVGTKKKPVKGFFFDYSISNSFFVIKRRLWFGVNFYKCLDAFEHFLVGSFGLLEHITEKNIRSSYGDRLV